MEPFEHREGCNSAHYKQFPQLLEGINGWLKPFIVRMCLHCGEWDSIDLDEINDRNELYRG